jgi:hypothetical protein
MLSKTIEKMKLIEDENCNQQKCVEGSFTGIVESAAVT